jgi:hypothetical protein
MQTARSFLQTNNQDWLLQATCPLKQTPALLNSKLCCRQKCTVRIFHSASPRDCMSAQWPAAGTPSYMELLQLQQPQTMSCGAAGNARMHPSLCAC